MKRVAVIHGPNVNLLGRREPEHYRDVTLAEIDRELIAGGRRLGLEVECFQANGEGAIIDHLHGLAGKCDGVIINPGGYTHTSVAIRDALLALDLPTIEVHLSNIYGREDFRRRSLIADVVRGQIIGFGPASYRLALEAAAEILS